MKIQGVYIDNYRGFKKTLIPLSKMTFLVGENSSGKTSFLKLIEIITSGEFWYNGEFRNSDVDLSYFGDISISSSEHERNAKVGILYKTTDQKTKQDKYSAIAITLSKGNGGKTFIKDLRCIAPAGIEVLIVKSSSSRGVKHMYRENVSIDINRLQSWVEEDLPSRGYSKTDVDTDHLLQRSPYFLVSYTLHIWASLKKKSDKTSNKESKITVDAPDVMNPYTWIAPIRIKPKRTYDGNVYDYSADGAHAPYLLKNIFKKTSNDASQLITTLNKFGKSSGLFEEIRVKNFTRADDAPFAIEVIIEGESRNIDNVGYGVSQVLPVVVEVLNQENARFAIQQPEVHLHPKAQASLGELFFDIVHSTGSSFIIETHSDYIIDRYRQHLSKTRNKKATQDTQLIFFETKKSHNTATPIIINSDGSYSEDQPKSFKKFFFDEELRNLSI